MWIYFPTAPVNTLSREFYPTVKSLMILSRKDIDLDFASD